jgi:hypothetical protein
VVEPAAEQCLVLELFVAEANHGFECGLVTQPMVAALVEHLGGDEALHQAHHVGVGAALYLAQQQAVALAQELQFVDPGDAVGQKLAREVELPATDHVSVDVPANAFRHFHAARIAPGVDAMGRAEHGGSKVK